jgi:hypothetical protein
MSTAFIFGDSLVVRKALFNQQTTAASMSSACADARDKRGRPRKKAFHLRSRDHKVRLPDYEPSGRPASFGPWRRDASASRLSNR